MGRFSRAGNELYTGARSIDFVGRRSVWYSVSVVIVGFFLTVIVLNGFKFGIEFTGGTEYRVLNLTGQNAGQSGADKARDLVASSGIEDAGTPVVTTSGKDSLIVQVEPISSDEAGELQSKLQEGLGVKPGDVSPTEIGASWGKEVAKRAILGVGIFLILVVLFIWGYFREWKMSVAGLVALLHDVVITMGVYSLSGFTVTPAAVTGLLAILGFSMYDTVVVFDKIRENTHDLRRSGQTYSDAANLAVNQTLVRSINTSIVALIPIGAILYVSAVQLGASSLQDLALAQFVGMGVGIYSSVFIAPRLLVHMKQSEATVVDADRRARARAKRDVDKYANVPTFTEDMPVVEGSGELDEDDEGQPRTPFVTPASRASATGSGRVVPEPKAPIEPSGSAHRPQPTRQPRSKRGK
ncbi:protein translocase subunit SecF [Nocardioides marmoriginsengisoli]|uniref:Protein-export membrane protein SecF n=1 Tax=Nocardioides marmoriginsengisoli TaxID=661483 RepID=A0A3N0CMK5_9ACTN|nr:protein translocase subunit SecF [Nocardioides marmoriginsengisoli]RNL64133.1 protein translocase subunit SecF [Nocardioides marmoriginsengisoli]